MEEMEAGGGSDTDGGDAEYGTRIFTITVENELSAVPVVIVKIDQEGKKLENAEFTLSGTGMAEQTGIVSRILEKDGDAVIFRSDALNTGTYTLTETRAPAGCTLLETPITIKVEPGDTGLIVTAETGEKTGKYVEATRIDPNHPEKGWKVTVINVHGYSMPSTGGPGTHDYSIIGVILVLLGGAYLLIRRQKDRRITRK